MAIIIKKGSSLINIRKSIKTLYKAISEKQQKTKLKIVEDTFGSVTFFADKNVLDIQKEMRNEWD